MGWVKFGWSPGVWHCPQRMPLAEWLGLGLQICTAASPLASGAIAAASIPGAFVFDGALARVAAALLLFGARGLRRRPAA